MPWQTTRVSVNSQGSGVGGDIQVSARRINLDNNGDITAATQSTNGGNITVNVLDLLLMRHQSNISASAGEGQAGGNGGNITINAPKGFVVAVPREDNDVKAQAFTDRGGNVSITSQRRFGLEFREDDTPLSDITVSSRFGEDGTTQLNDLSIDPSRGLTQLPETPRIVELSEGCQVSDGKEAVQFFDIGRGGTPPRPDEPLNIDSYLIEWNQLDAEKSNSLSFPTITNITSNHENIRGKIFTPNWEIVKTNQLPTAITRMTAFCQSQ
ncbi:MAG: hypothetical protein RMZ42_06130 [Nostoc sp. DedQUE05]|uniref:hypothetical protein n=1 Tax=Nostoc sp. DedQUE05 TaxID=3075391 RepID=UPI002AD2280C|nr:hypothetical protein [Nostoc sp. DedQUE05]MDZ8091504.1 hypothetical protein [Nostoc sp. DedQUE05]